LVLADEREGERRESERSEAKESDTITDEIGKQLKITKFVNMLKSVLFCGSAE
jgi:hypothetical protein